MSVDRLAQLLHNSGQFGPLPSPLIFLTENFNSMKFCFITGIILARVMQL